MASLNKGSPNADTQAIYVPGTCSNCCTHSTKVKPLVLYLGISLVRWVLLEGRNKVHSPVLPQGLVQFKLQMVNDYTEL